jgi:hypothetical protein
MTNEKEINNEWVENLSEAQEKLGDLIDMLDEGESIKTQDLDGYIANVEDTKKKLDAIKDWLLRHKK